MPNPLAKPNQSQPASILSEYPIFSLPTHREAPRERRPPGKASFVLLGRLAVGFSHPSSPNGLPRCLRRSGSSSGPVNGCFTQAPMVCIFSSVDASLGDTEPRAGFSLFADTGWTGHKRFLWRTRAGRHPVLNQQAVIRRATIAIRRVEDAHRQCNGRLPSRTSPLAAWSTY